jgi:two-component system, NarL family, response regulator NreC
MNIVLVDDHPVLRKGLKSLLEEKYASCIAGEAGSGAEAISLISGLRPDIAVIDIKLPDISGFEVATAVKKTSPLTRIIMLSMHADAFHVDEALRSGADGYVVKNAMEHEIIDAVDAVNAGGRYFSKSLARSAEAQSATKPSPARDDPYHTLTKREKEILRLIAQGSQNKEIAEALFISPRTVETHRARIMRKLDLQSATELVHFAVRRNIITLT